MTYAIQLVGEAPPSFLSLRAARDFGSAYGWTSVRDQALQFARAQDAESFRDTFLLQQAPFCTITPIERTP